MNVTFWFEGENIDGDFLQSAIEFENVESFNDACKLAEKEAIRVLRFNGGGHMDILDEQGTFINDVEV